MHSPASQFGMRLRCGTNVFAFLLGGLLLLLCRWNGKDVAVKVIEHSGASAKAVQQEMSMMMSFQHPNIVR